MCIYNKEKTPEIQHNHDNDTCISHHGIHKKVRSVLSSQYHLFKIQQNENLKLNRTLLNHSIQLAKRKKNKRIH